MPVGTDEEEEARAPAASKAVEVKMSKVSNIHSHVFKEKVLPPNSHTRRGVCPGAVVSEWNVIIEPERQLGCNEDDDCPL